VYCKNKSRLNRQERQTLEKGFNVKLAKGDSMDAKDKNLNNRINILEIKL
jgi:hypothetical protein